MSSATAAAGSDRDSIDAQIEERLDFDGIRGRHLDFHAVEVHQVHEFPGHVGQKTRERVDACAL